MKKYCFLHSAIMGNYLEVNKIIIDNIINSGLYDKLDKIFIFNLGGYYNIDMDKIEVFDLGSNLGLCEYPTLTKLQEFSKKNDGYFLYLTNHGVSHYNDEFRETARSWRELLSYYVINRHEDCIKALDDNYDVSGPEWMKNPLPHFSGNWWWTKNEYLNTLVDVNFCKEMNIPMLGKSFRHGAEMWIGTNPNVKAKSFFVSGYDWNTRPKRTDWLKYIK
jgi:hypothetical protein